MYEVRKLRKLGESQWVKIIAFGDVNSMVKKNLGNHNGSNILILHWDSKFNAVKNLRNHNGSNNLILSY